MRDYLELPRAVHVLCLGSFINRAGSFVMIFLTIYLSEKLNFGSAFATKSMGVFGVGSIVASLVGGQLADQIGRKTVMLFALIGGALLLLVLGHATTKATIYIAIFAYALVAESFRPACMAMLGDLTTPQQRPNAFGLLYVSINLGFACGPPVGGVLADVSYDLLFWMDALTMGAFALIIAKMVPKTSANDGVDPQDVPERVALRDAAKRIFGDRSFLLFCVATLLISVVFMQSFTTLPICIKDAGYSNFQFGMLMAINGIMIVICQLPLTSYLERFKSMTNILYGAVLIGLGFACYVFPLSLTVLVVAILLWTTGEMMQAPFKQTMVTAMAPNDLRGRYMGTHGVSHSLALVIGAPLGGLLLSEYGPQALWGVCGVMSLGALAVYAISYRSLVVREEAHHAAS